MRDDFRRLFADSMDTVHLSREAKERLIASLAKQAAYDQGKAETGMENQGKRKAFRRAMVLALGRGLLGQPVPRFGGGTPYDGGAEAAGGRKRPFRKS